MRRLNTYLHAAILLLTSLGGSNASATVRTGELSVVRDCAGFLDITAKYRRRMKNVYTQADPNHSFPAPGVDQYLMVQEKRASDHLVITILRVPAELSSGELDVHTVLPESVVTTKMTYAEYARLLNGRVRVGEVRIRMLTKPARTAGTLTGLAGDVGSILLIGRLHYVVIGAGIYHQHDSVRPQLSLAKFEGRPAPGARSKDRADLNFDPGGEFKHGYTEYGDVFKVGEGLVMTSDLIGRGVQDTLTTFVAWTEEHDPRPQLTYDVELYEYRPDEPTPVQL